MCHVLRIRMQIPRSACSHIGFTGSNRSMHFRATHLFFGYDLSYLRFTLAINVVHQDSLEANEVNDTSTSIEPRDW